MSLKKLFVEVEGSNGKLVKVGCNESIEIRIFGLIEKESVQIRTIKLDWNEEEQLPYIETEELVEMEDIVEEQHSRVRAEVEEESVESKEIRSRDDVGE